MKFMYKVIGFFRGVWLICRSLGRTLKTQVRWQGIRIGYNTAIDGSCILVGDNAFGQNCVISKTIIGRATYCTNNVVISNAEIGSFTSIAANVKIGLHKHPTQYYVSTYPAFHIKWAQTPYLNCSSDFDVHPKTFIGCDVWIGDSAIILSGVRIGDGAIVGAGAVVTKDVPPYSIVCGVPAKVMRHRFSEAEIEKLLEIKWWEWDKEKIARFQSSFKDINEFLKEDL